MAGKQRLNVLVIDQDEASNIDLKDFLTQEGYQPHALNDPAACIEEIKRGRFQLVILDVSPPVASQGRTPTTPPQARTSAWSP